MEAINTTNANWLFTAPQTIGLLLAPICTEWIEKKEFNFNAGLTSIVGGKGVGKSLIIEFVRFALDQRSSIDGILEDVEGKLRDQLTVGSTVTVVAQLRTGDQIAVERTYDGISNPIRAWHVDSGDSIEGRISDIFPILAYSQTEAVEIAKDEGSQLKLIDTFMDLSSYRRQIEDIHKKLQKLDLKLADSIAAKIDLKSRQKDLSTLQEQIKQLDKTLASPRFGELQKLEPKTSYLQSQSAALEEMQNILGQLDDDLAAIDRPTVPPTLEKDSAIKKAKSTFNDLLADLKKAAKSMNDKAAKAATKLSAEAGAWDKTVQSKTKEYEKWLQTVGGDKPQLMARRKKLKRDFEQIDAQVKTLKGRVGEFETVRRNRNKLLDELDKLATTVYQSRQAEYSVLMSRATGRIKLELRQGTNRERFASALGELKRGSRLRVQDIESIVQKVHPREFVDLVIDQDAKALGLKTGVDLTIIERLVDTLVNHENFAEVVAIQHTAWPDDVPVIQYQKDDGKYYDLKGLSVGQKCTALLIIALTEGDMPVVIDQPEDSLDIPSVYRDITQQLRIRKDARQFVLTTHNPTVAVTADSDKFLVLTGSATAGDLAAEGAIERGNVREQIIAHLEGGKESYGLKSRKYGLRSR